VDGNTGCPVTGQELYPGWGGGILVRLDVAAAAGDAHSVVRMPGV